MAADGDGTHEEWAAFRTLLAETKLRDMAHRKPAVVVIPSTSSLADAFTTLITHRITSAPVHDAASGKYTGFLDIRDLVSFIVHYGKHVTEGDFVVADVCAAGSGSVLTNVTVTYLSRRNPFKSAKDGASLLDALPVLGSGATKRLAVLDASGAVVNVISQSDVIVFISKHCKLIPSAFAHAPVRALFHSEFKPVVAVGADEPVLTALQRMDDSKITGVAITHDGVLVGNVSGKDLKSFIRAPSYAQLHMPVMQMVKELRQRESVDIGIPVISVFPGCTFDTCVAKIAATKVHRVYVVESEERFRAIGIVSQTAVLKRLAAVDALQ